MDRDKAKERIGKLKKLIQHYSYLYHVLDKPEISDAAWDSLKKELADLEKLYPQFIMSDSPTQRVSGKPLDKFKKAVHSIPMLSLQDAFSFEEVKEWEERITKIAKIGAGRSIDYYVELKIDGLAISLVYKNGVFFRGATRGDGKIGEDVTQNLKTVDSIPLRLRKNIDCEIRGEVYITKKNFQKFADDYANSRNLAAGSVRQLDSGITASRRLSFMSWQFLGEAKQSDESGFLVELGVKPVPGKHCKNLEEVKKYFESVKRGRLAYEIDGIVVGVNDNKLMSELGVAGKSPRGAIAWKFPAKEAVSRIKDIKVQVGRTGVLTPVAIFDPVPIKGVVISRATLHNKDEINRLELKIGDTVVVSRAGDVIPDVKRVLKELRTGSEKFFRMPAQCPVCGKDTEEDKGGILVRCVNKKCPSRQKRHLAYFVSRLAFNIEGLGPKIINSLLDQGLIQDAADLFSLEEGDLLPLERFAEKSASNLIKSIREKKKISLPRFIISLGMSHVGEQTAYDLAEKFGSLDKLRKVSEDELLGIKDIGPISSKSIYDWFRSDYNISFLGRILKHVTVEDFQSPNAGRRLAGTNLGGKKFIFTGSLSSMTRDEAKDMVRRLGGETTESVSRDTDYVVAGKEAGLKKEKALKLGVRILSEQEFLDMIQYNK